jgi:hypothetical protein
LTLKRFHRAGIFTWVSLEPTLDVAASVQIVEQTPRFVDLFKVDRANYLPMTKTTNWKDYTERMIEVLAKVRARSYIKKDLQPNRRFGWKRPSWVGTRSIIVQ